MELASAILMVIAAALSVFWVWRTHRLLDGLRRTDIETALTAEEVDALLREWRQWRKVQASDIKSAFELPDYHNEPTAQSHGSVRPTPGSGATLRLDKNLLAIDA